MWTCLWMMAALAQEAEPTEAPEPAPVETNGPTQEMPDKLKRRKLPQLPYAQVDFTAYTLEKGETRIGLTEIGHGFTQSFQVSTVPLLWLIGATNVGVKGWVFRKERFDVALQGKVYYVPVSDIINRLSPGEGLNAGSSLAFDASINLFQVGGKYSLRPTQKWSIHGGWAFARATAHGDFTLGRLPQADIPELGTIGGGKVRLVGDLIGEAALLNLATDFRFNRRDSIVLQVNAPVYYNARGQIDMGDYTKDPVWAGMFIAAGYGQWVPLTELSAASLSWQFSWKHWDLRLGIGLSKQNALVKTLAAMQAFNLTYRFGGSTRTTERERRKEIKEERRDIRRD